jgi:hypothetical protein
MASRLNWLGLLVLFALAISISGCGTSSPPPPPAPQTFIGTVGTTDAKVGLVVVGGDAVLFFCGGDSSYATLSHYLKGPLNPDHSFSFTDGTATGAGAFTESQASGTLDPGGGAATVNWTASLAPAAPGTLEGVYSTQLPNAGKVGVIIVQPTANDPPVVQGALVELSASSKITAVLQVTPFDQPLRVTPQGIGLLTLRDPNNMFGGTLPQFFVTRIVSVAL